MGERTSTRTTIECDGCDLREERDDDVEPIIDTWTRLSFEQPEPRIHELGRLDMPPRSRVYCDPCLDRVTKALDGLQRG